MAECNYGKVPGREAERGEAGGVHRGVKSIRGRCQEAGNTRAGSGGASCCGLVPHPHFPSSSHQE
jgi:hypothetical protein